MKNPLLQTLNVHPQKREFIHYRQYITKNKQLQAPFYTSNSEYNIANSG